MPSTSPLSGQDSWTGDIQEALAISFNFLFIISSSVIFYAKSLFSIWTGIKFPITVVI